MLYKKLGSLYYDKTVDFNQVYLSYFNSPSTIKFDFEINGNQAFFMYNSETLNYISNILNYNSKLNTLDLPDLAKMKYITNRLIEEIKLTNEMEGVSSTRKEIKQILDNKTKDDVRLYNLVNKYKLLINKEKIYLESCTDIKKLYDEIVLKEVVKEDKNNFPDGTIFRKNTVYIYNDKNIKIHTGAYPEEKIIDLLSKTLNILKNDEICNLISLSIFHYMFGYIHPFYDGNGRLNRFITSYLLSQNLNPLVSFNLSYTIKKQKKHYDKMFTIINDINNKGDLTPFIIDFLKILNDTIIYTYDNLNEKNKKLVFYLNILENIFDGKNNEYQVLSVILQKTLFDDIGIDIYELLDVKFIHYGKSKILQIIKTYKNIILCEKISNKNIYSINLNYLDELNKKELG